MTGPATTTNITARPPPGPARGSVPAPVWLVVTLSLGLALFACFALVRSYRRRRR